MEVWSSRTDGVREMLRAESSAYEPGRMTPSVSLPRCSKRRLSYKFPWRTLGLYIIGYGTLSYH